ncbi:N-acetyl-gamma-glutamyl-phosphate reductase [Acetobacteraceae bacterium]|nr:N-acetyl-gamma-glutamyl-phosphate reductase [Acetobacteraceae bacterium]
MISSALNKKIAVFIDGMAGTTGLSLRQRIEEEAFRPFFTLLTLPEELRKDENARREMMQQADITVLCLPDQAVRQAVSLAQKTKTRILDASSVHRVDEGWIYGFPELEKGQAEKIAHAERVSNPGCYATGAIAILRPLMRAGILPESYPISLQGISGYSGGGRGMISAWEKEDSPSFELYALMQTHKHLPEITKYASLFRTPLFVPAVGKFERGMVVLCPLDLGLLPKKYRVEEIREILTSYYADCSQSERGAIRILSGKETLEEKRLSPEKMAGRDDLILRVQGEEGGRLVITAHFDNLGKGAAGAALSNLLLMRKYHF